MKINQAGIDLIKSFEGCRLKVYKDAVGIPTVGYGHVTDMEVGDEISQNEADQLLREDLEHFERGVENLLVVKINENQFSALVCFAYNVGLANLKQSLLLRCINKHNVAQAADQFLRWTRAGGIELAGLVKRRNAERTLFLA